MLQHLIAKAVFPVAYIDGIKEGSFRFVEQVNDDGNLRFGSAISSSVEFEVYEDTPTFSVGDEFTYAQKTDMDPYFNELQEPRIFDVNRFIVKSVTKGKKTYKYVGYDYLDKLNVDYSERLLENKANFPMSVHDIITDIASFCHVSILSRSLYWFFDGTSSFYQIPYFYSNGITARDILMRIAELNGQYIRAVLNNNGSPIIVFGAYQYTRYPNPGLVPSYWMTYRMIVCPTDTIDYYDDSETKLIPVWYKENGLEKADYQLAQLNRAVIKRTNGETVYDSDNDSEPLPYGDNVYAIYGNYIAEGIYDADLDIGGFSSCKDFVESILNDGITPMTVHLFPFRNPYRVGSYIRYMADADGNRFSSLVMKMEVTDADAVLYCYGNEKYMAKGVGNSQYTVAQINDLESALDAVEQSLSDVSDSVDTLTTDVGTIQTDVGTLQTDVGQLDQTVSTLSDDLDDVKATLPNYTHQSVTLPSTQIAAGANATVTVSLSSSTPTGFTAVGIIGAYTNHLNVWVTGWWINLSSNTLLLALHNNSTSDVTVSSGLIRVLYAKQ